MRTLSLAAIFTLFAIPLGKQEPVKAEPEPAEYTRCSGLKPLCWPGEHAVCICQGRNCYWTCQR